MGWRPKGLRTSLISVLDGMGVLEAAMIVRKHVRMPYLPIVTYHRLGHPAVDGAELDDSVIDASPEGFEKQVALFKKRFTLLGVEDLHLHFKEQRPLPKNAAIITFDDGYKPCYDVALPILKRAGAKAVFFISTHHMNDRKVFWWDRTNYIVKKSKKKKIELSYPKPATFELADNPRDRVEVINEILDVIKHEYDLDLERYLGELASACDVSWGPAEEKRITDDILMTWDQVRELRDAGMDIESHSHTHRVLTTLPPAQVKNELELSKKILEEKLDTKVRSIAYPVSLSLGKADEVLRAVRDAGYDIGFSTSSGLGPLGPKTNPLDIQRFWVDPTLPHSYFRAALAVPHLTYRAR